MTQRFALSLSSPSPWEGDPVPWTRTRQPSVNQDKDQATVGKRLFLWTLSPGSQSDGWC